MSLTSCHSPVGGLFDHAYIPLTGPFPVPTAKKVALKLILTLSALVDCHDWMDGALGVIPVATLWNILWPACNIFDEVLG